MLKTNGPVLAKMAIANRVMPLGHWLGRPDHDPNDVGATFQTDQKWIEWVIIYGHAVEDALRFICANIYYLSPSLKIRVVVLSRYDIF
jgi:hypothetical protein